MTFSGLKKPMNNQFLVLYQNRFCDQEDLSIVVIGGENESKNANFVKPFLIHNFDFCNKQYFPSFSKSRYDRNTVAPVTSGSDIYIVDDYEVSDKHPVKINCYSANSWKNLPPVLEKRTNFCICSYMQKLFVIGGHDGCGSYAKSCMFYDKRNDKWTFTKSMKEGRQNAACTVFEGRIVVSGGCRKKLIPDRWDLIHEVFQLKSVEAYDYHDNKWTYFPSMLLPRKNHIAISISSKMFIIGGCFRHGNSSEVFDSFSRKFTYIKSEPKWIRYVSSSRTVCIGQNIYFLVRSKYGEVNVYNYEVQTDEFSLKTCWNIENNVQFTCVRLSMF